MSSPAVFNLMETTIDAIHQAYKSGQLTPRQLVISFAVFSHVGEIV
jgi:hypothetical protein